jgi:DivIVA domain-containing protein
VKRKETPAEDSGFQQSPGRLTPLDIQEKTFRTARMSGGYHVREVDEFLDQVTDTLSALLAENERLRAAAAKGPGAPPETTAAPASPVQGATDRAAVESFLRREKSFLQSLGGLVQEHAEVLREMARSARRGPGGERIVERSVHEAPTTGTVEAAEETSASPPEEAAPVEERVVAAASAEPEPEGPIDLEDEGMPGSAEEPPDDEEPIRLEETERVSRIERDQEPSLRELFWGEE